MIDNWLADLPPLPDLPRIKAGDIIAMNWGNGIRETLTVEEHTPDGHGQGTMHCRTDYIEVLDGIAPT